MGNVLCIIGSKIDDFASYGYKYLGKRNGQKVYRRVVEQPIVRGFMFRTSYPDTFKLTEFAFVDDAGKVVRQSARRVGTFGKETDATRVNMSQYTKFDKDFKIVKFHETETMPRPQSVTDDFIRINDQNITNGLFDQTMFAVNKDGTITNATRKINTANPHRPEPLVGEYKYLNWAGNRRVGYTQQLSNAPINDSKYFSEKTVEEAAKELTDATNLPKFQWTLESLRNPNFYKNLTGPGEIKTYTAMHLY